MLWSIVITMGIVSGFSGMLALLLTIGQQIFNNYGYCTILVNNQRTLTVSGGYSLLEILNRENIYLPSACGGRGSCGFCKCRIIKGGGPLLPTERPFLSSEEINRNIRLACQVKIKKDIEIEIPDTIFNIQKFVATVMNIKNVTHDIKEITLQLTKKINFKAGQYVQVKIPPYEKSKHAVIRAYSISSSPLSDDIIQLLIRKVPDGICTTWIHEYMQQGDSLEIIGPFGDFYIRDGSNDMLFVAGGSGKAPIKSMIDFLESQNSSRRMGYFFGARTAQDLYYVDHFKKMEKKLLNFQFESILSHPQEDDKWTGKTGYVVPYLKTFITNPTHTDAYLCGSPGMIAAVLKELHELGITDEHIFYDKF